MFVLSRYLAPKCSTLALIISIALLPLLRLLSLLLLLLLLQLLLLLLVLLLLPLLPLLLLLLLLSTYYNCYYSRGATARSTLGAFGYPNDLKKGKEQRRKIKKKERRKKEEEEKKEKFQRNLGQVTLDCDLVAAPQLYYYCEYYD